MLLDAHKTEGGHWNTFKMNMQTDTGLKKFPIN